MAFYALWGTISQLYEKADESAIPRIELELLGIASKKALGAMLDVYQAAILERNIVPVWEPVTTDQPAGLLSCCTLVEYRKHPGSITLRNTYV